MCGSARLRHREARPGLDAKRQSLREAVSHIARVPTRTRTLRRACTSGAMQLVVVSALRSWLPSFLNRVLGVAPALLCVMAMAMAVLVAAFALARTPR